MRKIPAFLLWVFAAWLLGLSAIVLALYISNDGSDFTVTDLMGFGGLFVIASGILMLMLYTPGLFWLGRRAPQKGRLLFPLTAGVFLNLPIFMVLGFLIGRKMVASEALFFMLAFLVSGMVFGLGFFVVQQKTR